MYISVILGTACLERQSEKAAKFIFQEVIKVGLESEIIDVRDYKIYTTDNTKKLEQAKILAEKIQKADALIVVSPE